MSPPHGEAAHHQVALGHLRLDRVAEVWDGDADVRGEPLVDVPAADLVFGPGRAVADDVRGEEVVDRVYVAAVPDRGDSR